MLLVTIIYVIQLKDHAFYSLYYLAVVSVIFSVIHRHPSSSIVASFFTKPITKNRCQLLFSFPIQNVLFCDTVLPLLIYSISVLYLMHKGNMMTVVSLTGNMTASYCKHHVAYLIRIVIERIEAYRYSTPFEKNGVLIIS